MKISPSESAVMEVLWRKHPRTAEEIAAELRGKRQWREATIKTLLNRLLKKGAVNAIKEGRRYLYEPRVERSAYLFAESSGVIDRLFGGRVAPLVAQFSENRKISKKDLEELKRLVEEMQHER